MVTEREPSSDSHNPLKILNGKIHTVAETFLIRNPNCSDEALRAKACETLSDQGVNGPIAVTFWGSEEERIKGILTALKIQEDSSASGNPQMFIVGFDAIQLREMSKVIIRMAGGKDPIIAGVDPKNITLLQLNAQSHMDPVTDTRTGLTLATLRKGELAYLMHPTPAH